MKKVALTVAVLALGLAACESKTADAVDNTAIANGIEADAEAIDNSVDNGLDAIENTAENAGDAVENVANAADNEI